MKQNMELLDLSYNNLTKLSIQILKKLNINQIYLFGNKCEI